ncbi:tyrosine-type recombinase/integrase [bacterium]|nr:tyrosine-type recombinase/integrase [bacterium]
MASISSDKNGNRTIQFVGSDRKRRSVRLGKVTMKDAEAICTKLETILAFKLSQRPFDAETAKWIGGLDPVLADRIAPVRLIPPRETAEERRHQTLIGFIDEFIAKRTDVKQGTRISYRQARKYLALYFKADRLLNSVTRLDVEQWRACLLTQGLNENSTRGHAKVAKTFFGAAVKGELIAKNPFAGFKTKLVARPYRQRFVTLEETRRLLDAAPNMEWRTIIALARYGGLRTPSETLALRWRDVDWDRGRVHIHSPKTEHHEGMESRWTPLFPELREVLADAFDLADDGAEFVITRYRDTNQNLRTQMQRIIKRAGLVPWERLFQNLRSSRETELVEQYPMHLVVKWLGNSQVVAREHYLQVRDEDFQRAASEQTRQAVQNPVQSPAARHRREPHTATTETDDPAKCSLIQQDAICRKALQGKEIFPRGFREFVGSSFIRRKL